MRLKFVVTPCALAAVCWIPPGFVSAAEANLPGTAAAPADLVRAALKTELGGPSDLRKTLLDEALKRDPNFAPARWQSGFVRRDGEWLTIDRVAIAASRDEALSAYCKLRDQLVSTAENQIVLARWCRKNKMPDQERIHWAKVLEFEPDNSEALAALGLQLHEGQLLTKQQIEQKKKQAVERLRAMQHWRPQLVKWRAAFESGLNKQRESAMAHLRGLSNPEAIPALESIFGDNRQGEKLNLLLVETVDRMPQKEAAAVLLRRAIIAGSKQVRAAATNALKKRPLYDYVPQLIAAIPRRDVRTRHEITVCPDRTVIQEHEFLIQTPSGDRYFYFRDEDQPLFPQLTQALGPKYRYDMAAWRVNMIQSWTASLEQQLDQQRHDDRQLTERIELVLTEAANFKQLTTPEPWLTQWDNYTESYSPPAFSAPNQGYGYFAQLRFTESCFPAGTLILSLVGSTAIEKILAGDCVLSQNPQTGELAYKTVQGVTLRPPSKMIEIGIGSEKIRATRGHPFWVNGKGWLMAKQLTVGDVLHALNGAARIESIEEAPPKEAYNLVLTGFNTYFVGNQEILVHDNLPLEETSALVPGLLAESDLQTAK